MMLVVMAEKWITGREFTISFLNGQPLPVIRLQPPADVAFMTMRRNISVMMWNMAFLVV